MRKALLSGLSLGRTYVRNGRARAFLAYLIAGSLFWSTAAVEMFSLLFLLASIPLISTGAIMHSRFPLAVWACYVAGVIVSFALSGVSNSQSVHLSVFWHTLLFPATLLRRFSKEECNRLLHTVAFSASAASAASLVAYVLTHPAYAEPVATTLTAFSILVGLAVGPILYLLIRENDVRWQLIYGTLFVLITLEVFFSARFVSMVLFVLGTAVFLVFAGRKFLPFIAAVPLIALFLSPDATWYKLRYLIGGGMTDRYLVWTAGLEILRDVPFFGYGPGSFHELLSGNLSPAFMYTAPSGWHNDYLAGLVESGWVTGLLFTGGVVIGVILLGRVMMKTSAGDHKLAAALWLSLSVGMGVAAGTSSVVSTALLGVAWWIVQGGVSAFLLQGGNHPDLTF